MLACLKRIHLAQGFATFVLGAVFMYSIQIFYSYPTLEKYSRSTVRATVDADRKHNLGFDDGNVDRIPLNHGHNAQSETYSRVGHTLYKMVDHARGNGEQNKFALMIDEAERLLAEDIEKESGELPKEGEKKIEPEPKRRDTTYNKDRTITRHQRYVDEPIDAHEYDYLLKPHACSKVDGKRLKMFLIFIVSTAPWNFERRMLIRNTYGNKRKWPLLSSGTFRTVFLLGAVGNQTLQNTIRSEHETYRDIVQEDFLDSYGNLTLKTVMGLKWVTNHCRHARYTMKIDDDTMIHQEKLLQLLKYAPAVNFTAAGTLIKTPVIRDRRNKHYISETYYPSPTYPPYLNGPGYLLSTDLAEGLYKVAVRTPLFPWEDVFLGICLKQLGIIPRVYRNFIFIQAREFHNKARLVDMFLKHRTVVSNLAPEDMMLMWTIGSIE
ncbi:beta-1,3-galactosyltransferase 1-like [Lytechinus pictus]|uniref:beta-1,3-galactosyltransferase 1-like n=1 Tax=Lytechinus pictus TaxID=7653 RepID=UPI0030B9D9BD